MRTGWLALTLTQGWINVDRKVEQVTIRGPRSGVKLALPALTLVVAVAVGACGSSSSATSSGIGSTSSASEAATSASATSTSGASSALAAATTRPSQIPVMTPIGKPIPKGKTIVYVPSPSPSATGPVEDSMKAAAAALGWNLKVVTPTGATATAALSAFQQAINDRPDGLVYWAFPQAEIGSELSKAKAAGIPIVAANTGEKVGSLPGVIAQPLNGNYVVQLESAGGKLLGLLAKPGTGIAFVELTGFIPVGNVEAAVKASATHACTTCTYKLKEINVTELPQAPKIIAEFLQANPGVKTVFLVDYATFGTGLAAQLHAVGISGVKVISADLTQQGLADVKSGALFVGGSLFPFTEAGYLSMDAFARHFVGQNPLVDNAAPAPYWFTTSTAPAAYSDATIIDVRGQFLKLWGQ